MGNAEQPAFSFPAQLKQNGQRRSVVAVGTDIGIQKYIDRFFRSKYPPFTWDILIIFLCNDYGKNSMDCSGNRFH